MKSYKHLYKKTFEGRKDFHHFAAHSHHPWPDCTLEAHQKYWSDSILWLDEKWDNTFGQVIPQVQKNIAQVLNLSYPEQIALAPNTHEFVLRLFSCLDFSKPVKVLATDSEFHSFRRQFYRYTEMPNVQIDVVAIDPYESYEQRWLEKISSQKYDFIFTSQVFFNSGLECVAFEKWIPKVDSKTIIAIDGYHAFCAIPTDLSKWQDRIFYLAGGYKYAQAGEGVCFLSVPKDNNLRPLNTGWFADFAALAKPDSTKINYAQDGMQFAGSTFDASGCYRWNSVCKMFNEHKLTVKDVHARVMELKKYFLEKIQDHELSEIGLQNVIGQKGSLTNAHYVTFKTAKAKELQELLGKNNVIVDSRGDRLRFGFGLYHDLDDIDRLCKKISSVFSKNSSQDVYEKSAAPESDLEL